MKIKFEKGLEKWRSPELMFNLFELRFFRTTYVYPCVIAYCFKLTLLGYKIRIEIRRDRQ